MAQNQRWNNVTSQRCTIVDAEAVVRGCG